MEELSAEEIRYLLAAARLLKSAASGGTRLDLLQGKTVANLFFEDSTRTRLSFEAAARKLSAQVTNFSVSTSSMNKGETTGDTARTLAALGPDAVVVRHPSSGGPAYLAGKIGLPIVNAGDGQHEHPTQALLDILTLEEAIGPIQGKRVLIVGDILHSRVARSNIHAMKKLGAEVVLCGPATLVPQPDVFGTEVSFQLDPVLPTVDAVMMLRIQKERQNAMQIPSTGEFSRFWGLNAARAAKLKPKAIVMHPGPMNRGVEIAAEVADGPLSVIERQVANGVYARMAVLAAVCAPERLEKWLAKEGHLA